VKRFSFRLEKVLRYRKYLESKAQIKLMDAINEYHKKENLIRMIIAKRKELSDECGGEKKKGMDVARYRLYYHYFRKLNDEQEAGGLALKKTGEKVQTHRMLLTKESIKKKTLETLKEVQHGRYQEISGKEEQKMMDETAIIRIKRVNL
jgi:flagellar export protein FliJ